MRNVISVTEADSFLLQFAIRTFLLKAIYAEGYVADKSLSKMIGLTKNCHEYLEEHRTALNAQSDNDLIVGAFIASCSGEYWVDHSKTDYKGILAILSSEIASGQIKFPWIYGRDLLDKFENQPFKNKDELNAVETRALLDDAPQGVFQVGKYLCGPFGILASDMPRAQGLFPTLEIPIKYCTDPACRHLHEVELSSNRPSFLNAFKSIRNHQEESGIKIFGLRKEYRNQLSSIDKYYDSLNTEDLPMLLGNGFVLSELREIASYLLNEFGGNLRSKLPKDKRLSGKAAEIVGRLNNAELMQITLLMPDKDIVKAIETKIEERLIVIPRGEIRDSHYHLATSWMSMQAQCSSEGVRFVPINRLEKAYVAQMRMHVLLLKVFPSEQGQLDYVLRGHAGPSVEQKLEQFILLTSPYKIIREVFLPVGSRVNEVEKALEFGLFIQPDGNERDESWVRKVSWKLGYEPTDVESVVSSFDAHHKDFVDVVRRNNPCNSTTREKVRQASISYFVALEAILDLALTFSVWALSSDHYADTRFKFRFAIAKESVSELLSSAASAKESTVSFDPNGRWTLYPLIEGFRILSEYLAGLDKSTRKKKQNLREKSSYPGFYNKTSLAQFPFEHRFAFFDLSDESRQKILSQLLSITQCLNTANVAGLRNKLEHNRPVKDFPTQNELEVMCESVAKILMEMELSGCIPTPFTLLKRTSDQFGRGIFQFGDFRGREIEILWPHQLNYSTEIDFDSPVVIFSDAIVKGTAVPLRFNWVGDSKYTDYWKGHPNRR